MRLDAELFYCLRVLAIIALVLGAQIATIVIAIAVVWRWIN